MIDCKFIIKKRFYDREFCEYWDPQSSAVDDEDNDFKINIKDSSQNATYLTFDEAQALSETMPEYFELEETKPGLKRLYNELFHSCFFTDDGWEIKIFAECKDNVSNKLYYSYNYFPTAEQAQEAIDTIFSKVAMPEWKEKLIEFHEKKGNLK